MVAHKNEFDYMLIVIDLPFYLGYQYWPMISPCANILHYWQEKPYFIFSYFCVLHALCMFTCLECKMYWFVALLFPFVLSNRTVNRYFTTPLTETEKTEQDVLFKKILNESLTFHFWNSLTSSLIPESDSLVTRLIERSCIRCSDVLWIRI